MDTTTVIPSHKIAAGTLDFIDSALDFIGLRHHQTLEEIIYVAIIIAVSFGVGWIVRRLALVGLRKIVAMRHSVVSREMLELHTPSKCTHIIPPLIFLAFVPFAFTAGSRLLTVLERAAVIYILIALGIGLCAVITLIYHHYNTYDNHRNLPLKGVRNIAMGIVWIVIVIVAVSVAFDRSPAVLLTGLGAFAAALMLVFKDSILGFVAGIQMSQNDMLHVGDWIVVPSTPANGTVLDVSLSAVKVRNWDNTIVTVPPYTLVSTSFQNYRGMTDSGARRITKTLTMDVSTVTPLDPAGVDAIVARVPLLKPFVDGLRQKGATAVCDGGLTPVNGTIETNLGLFRAYISLYVLDNPGIAKDQQILIRIMDPNEDGLPLQIYCFTNTTAWDAYEGIQSAIVEHVTTMAPIFGLAVYTNGSVTVEEKS